MQMFFNIVIIVVLLIIGAYVVYNKIGYENPDDVTLDWNKGKDSITCRDALFYYFENEIQGSFTTSEPGWSKVNSSDLELIFL